MWDAGVSRALWENKKQAGCVLCSWRDSRSPQRLQCKWSYGGEKQPNMDRKHWRTPCSCSMNCESGNDKHWEGKRRRTSSMRWALSHGWYERSLGQVLNEWSDSSVEAGSRQGRGGRCGFPRWDVGEFQLRCKLLHKVWTHTQSFPTENFGVFYRKAHLSLVDTRWDCSRELISV